MTQADIPIIFDPRRKRAIRARAVRLNPGDDFLWQHMAEDLTERLADVSRIFEDILVIGPIGKYQGQILGSRIAEDRPKITLAALDGGKRGDNDILLLDDELLSFGEHSYDLIISAGTLDCINDLPGMLVQLRRCLRPDGLLLSNFIGGGSLGTLKAAMMKADGGHVAAHIHPQIDLRSAADLLSRSGFALPVADLDLLRVRYSNWRILIQDLRCSGFSNMLAGDRSYLGRAYPRRLEQAWNEFAEEDGKVSEKFAFVSLSGWAPSPDQPKPAKRGSATVSLADALKPKPD